MGLGPASSPDAPLDLSGAALNNGLDERVGAGASPTAHGDTATAAAVLAPGSPPSPAASYNGGEQMQPADSKRSLASEGSELGKEDSTAGSIYDSAASMSGSGSSGLVPHYDANQDVVLRLEFLRAKEIKVRGIELARTTGPLLPSLASVCACLLQQVT